MVVERGERPADDRELCDGRENFIDAAHAGRVPGGDDDRRRVRMLELLLDRLRFSQQITQFHGVLLSECVHELLVGIAADGEILELVERSTGRGERDDVTRLCGGSCKLVKHKKYDVHGIQFHPESVLTPNGKTIIANFLNA